MALTKFTDDVEVIQALSDTPNETEGLTADQLKKKFDDAVIDIKTYVNDTLTEEIDNNSVMTAVLTSNYTILADDTAEELTLIEGDSTGTKLTVSGGKIVIGTGVTKIKASACIGWLTVNTTQVKNTYIVKNSSSSTFNSKAITSGNVESMPITSKVLSVSAGDTISLKVYGKIDEVIYGSSRTWLTVEVI